MAASACSRFGFTCLLALALLAATASAAGEKETHLRVYWHDVVSGPNATVVQVAEGPSSNASATGFGTVIVIDDPLTEGPNLTSSRLIGRAQGMYVSAGKDSLSLLMAMNFVFVDGAYNGSSVAIVGANPAERTIREMPVVGGTGAFRLARGYCQARTHWFDAKTGDATVEYNVYIRHD
ncbi:dirigent protein 22-like [Phragmites australis]|uniref:dirigent protein 22-like n=1 Tax=Phragmites australis TaxID=29695 RepID=UPI002D78A5BB|nr:dirigent protein 22-like [Phragmites australis]